MPEAGATLPHADAHVTLDDGTYKWPFILCDSQGNINPLAIQRQNQNRTSLKTGTGESRYSDFEPPYIPIQQDDWSGGRAQEEFSRDRSRFFDSYRANTWQGSILLGPQETYGTGYRDQDNVMPGSVTFTGLFGATRYLAHKFAASAYDADKCYIWLRKVGTPNGNLTLELCSDDNGNPATGGGVKQTVNLAPGSVTDVASLFKVFDWTGAETLSATDFHIKVYGASGDDDATNHWEVGTNAATGTTQKSTDNTNWASATGIDLYFRIVDADDTWIAHFYDYKGQMYFVTAPDDATAPEVFINGHRGAADSNNGALTTLVDSGGGWTTDEWAGSVAVITGGPGYRDELNWRVIVSNTSTALTVSPAWDTEHTTDTEYVIIASNKFTVQAGHGLTKPVTDVLISKDVIYFAQGDGVAMRRGRAYNNSGTWTTSWDDEGGSTFAKFLQVIEDPVNGAQVWKANDSLSSEPSVARATAQAWGTDLTFGTAIVVGNRNERMTGLETYGDPATLWPFKEGSIWDVYNDIPNEKPLREMKAVASFKNGRAHLVQGVYLYFSLLNSLQRYFRNNLDDVGPWADAGLPADRQGVIYHMQGYPPFFLCALDGGASNYSSVLLSTGSRDWHEFYRAPEKGQRIRRLHMQVIPGSTIDRLWVSMGTDVLWLPFPSDTLDPYRDSNYRFTHESHVISSWHYANMQDVQKLYKSLKVFSENLTASAQTIEAEYQTDGDIETDTWTAINGTFDTVPLEEVDFSSTNSVTGRRLRYRLRLITTSNSSTPKVTATVLEAVGKVKSKQAWTFSFLASDDPQDVDGNLADVTGESNIDRVETRITRLDSWLDNPTVLTFRNNYSPFDNNNVLLESYNIRPFKLDADGQTEAHIGTMTLVEI